MVRGEGRSDVRGRKCGCVGWGVRVRVRVGERVLGDERARFRGYDRDGRVRVREGVTTRL